MKVILLPKAEKQLRKLPKIDQIAIAQKIRSIREEINSFQEEKLQGLKNVYRLRVGDYRIVYKRTSRIIYIILIRHRRDVYQLLRELLG